MAKNQMKQQIMDVTPDTARDWLKLNIDNNRAIIRNRVDGYIRAIKNGEWQLTPEGIMFDEEGNLIDGQHRLSAIAEAGKTVKMVVWSGVPFEAMEVLNTGQARSTADVLTVTGGLGVAGAAKIAVARASVIYRLHHTTFGTRKMTVSEYEWVKNRYVDDLDWAQRAYPLSGGGGNSGYPLLTRRFRSPTIMGAFIVAHKRNPEAVESFARKCDRGVELTERDPGYALRKFLEGANLHIGSHLERMIPTYAALKCIYSSIHHQDLSAVRTSFLTPDNAEFGKILKYFGVTL